MMLYRKYRSIARNAETRRARSINLATFQELWKATYPAASSLRTSRRRFESVFVSMYRTRLTM